MSGSVWMFSEQIDDEDMHYADRVQYLLDILLHGNVYEKQQLFNGKEVTALGEAIERCKEIEAAA